MSKFINSLKEALNTTSSLYMLVVLGNKDPNEIYCAFEGEDAKYYHHRIKILTNKNKITPLNCGGKKSVLDLHALLIKEKAFDQVLFFIDKDMDSNTQYTSHPRLYVTPTYSIENLYVYRDIIQTIISTEFLSNDQDAVKEELPEIMKIYDSLMTSFFKELAVLHSWIFLNKANHNLLRLNDLQLKDFAQCNYTSGMVVRKSTSKIRDIKQLTNPVPLHLHRTHYKQTVSNIGTLIDAFRGKYLAELTVEFLNHLKIQAASGNKPFNKRRRVKIQISKANFISELSQYAETPMCLKSFLNAA